MLCNIRVITLCLFRSRVLSMACNPSIIRFFRNPKLSENAGYGIDKILKWESLTGKSITFENYLLISTVTYPLASSKDSRNGGENNGDNKELTTREKILALIKENPKVTRSKTVRRIDKNPIKNFN